MRVLLLADSFNSLTQRVQAELGDCGHRVSFTAVDSQDGVRAAVTRHAPELTVAPMLTTAIPEDVWSRQVCLIVHPGPPGDRGPSSLDRAIQDGETSWGVTVLQAAAELDAGAVWASAEFTLPPTGKSDIYRGECADAAVAAVRTAERFASGTYRPVPQAGLQVRVRPFLRQADRRIDWDRQSTAEVLATLRAADSQPGVPDELFGSRWFLHGGHPEDRLRGTPGSLLATRAGAVCRATADGAVWIPQLRRRAAAGAPGIKLPATVAAAGLLQDVPERSAPLQLPAERRTFSDIRYEERDDTGFLRFSFPGGAMSTAQCRRLLNALRYARSRPTRVLVLGPARDVFSHGIHLNVIEAAPDPAAESWANIHAMNDVVEAILTTTDRLVVAAVAGNAAAGGVMLALAADEVWCRGGAVLNPHYRLMGLPGSEYASYTLPRRAGAERAAQLLDEARPMTAATAQHSGLADHVAHCSPKEFPAQVAGRARELAADPHLSLRIAGKQDRRQRDEAVRPLADYRARELAAMHATFFDPEADYHQLRRTFVHKRPDRARTPA